MAQEVWTDEEEWRDVPEGPKPTGAAAIARGLGQGVTAGFGDELAGAGAIQKQAMLNRMADYLPDFITKRLGVEREEFEPGDLYRQTRDADRAGNAMAKAARPYHYGGGEIAGGIASFAVPGVAAAKGVGGAVKVGAGIGAAEGLGRSGADLTTGDPSEYERAAYDTGAGMAFGGAAGAGGHYVGMIPGATSKWLKGLAERRMVKGAGALKSDIKGLPPERVQQIGRDLLDLDLPMFASKTEIGAAASEAKEMAGQAIGSTLEQIDNAGTAFDYDSVLRRLVDDYNALDPVARRQAGDLKKTILDLARAQESGGGFAMANQMKGSLNDSINWQAGSPRLPQRLAKTASGTLDDEIESQVGSAAGPEARAAFEKAKSQYGSFKQAEKFVARGMEGDTGNRAISLTDYLAGGSGMAAGDPTGGLALGLANNLGRRYGSQSIAKVADKASKFMGLADRIKLEPETLGKFAPALQKALMNEGPTGLAVHHYARMHSDPEYRAHMNSIAGRGD